MFDWPECAPRRTLTERLGQFLLATPQGRNATERLTASLDGSPLLPWMVCKQPRVRKRAARPLCGAGGICGALGNAPDVA